MIKFVYIILTNSKAEGKIVFPTSLNFNKIALELNLPQPQIKR